VLFAMLTSVALRCLIIDDNPSFVEAARKLLQGQGIEVVAIAASGEEGVRSARELRPDVVLVDIDLGAESGFEVVRRLAEAAPAAPRMILISTHDEHEFIDLIDESPALGFLAKTDLSAAAIRQLLAQADPPEEPADSGV
jgi:two-component system, NarL family, nitrate/nitrite response regulator NarL